MIIMFMVPPLSKKAGTLRLQLAAVFERDTSTDAGIDEHTQVKEDKTQQLEIELQIDLMIRSSHRAHRFWRPP